MKIIETIDAKTYIYTENFWTGKRELSISGVSVERTSKKSFYCTEDGKSYNVSIKGNFLTGIQLFLPNTSIVLAQNKWYDWLLILCPLIGFTVGIFCGAIGGFLCGLFTFAAAIVNTTFIRSKKPILFKVIGSIGVAVIANVIWFILYTMIAAALLNLIA